MYDTGQVPERLTTRQAKELRGITAQLYDESLNYPNYEGRFGASAREIRTALLNAAHRHEYKCLSPFAVFDEIRDILASKSVYEFLRQEVVGRYHDHAAFLQQTEEIFAQWIDDEVRSSMGLAEEQSYGEMFSRYVMHISHWVKHEKMRDPTSGDFRDPDANLMSEVEHVLMTKGEKPEDFRKAVIGTIGARALDNPQQAPDYNEIFKGYIQRLKEDFFHKRRKVIRRLNEDFMKFTSDERKNLAPKEAEQAQKMQQTMYQKCGYCEHCARDVVAYLLKKRYAD